MLLHANSVSYRKRLFFCKKRRSGIALFFRVIPVLMIPRKIQVNLTGLQLRLLQTEYIGICLMEEVQKILSHTGTQAVHIPGNQFSHIISPYKRLPQSVCG